jgi:hypothetical protein
VFASGHAAPAWPVSGSTWGTAGSHRLQIVYIAFVRSMAWPLAGDAAGSALAAEALEGRPESVLTESKSHPQIHAFPCIPIAPWCLCCFRLFVFAALQGSRNGKQSATRAQRPYRMSVLKRRASPNGDLCLASLRQPDHSRPPRRSRYGQRAGLSRSFSVWTQVARKGKDPNGSFCAVQRHARFGQWGQPISRAHSGGLGVAPEVRCPLGKSRIRASGAV